MGYSDNLQGCASLEELFELREVNKDVPIMIHLDNGGFNEMYVDWFDNYMTRRRF